MNDAIAGRDGASATAATAALKTMPFRRDDDAPFPMAGAALLLILLCLAAWAWWNASKRSRADPARGHALVRFWSARTNEAPRARILGTTRLGPGSALHVVTWRGTELLIAVNGASGPAVLGRYELDKGSTDAGEPP